MITDCFMPRKGMLRIDCDGEVPPVGAQRGHEVRPPQSERMSWPSTPRRRYRDVFA